MRPVRPKLGVALGGGCARGYAHIGALKALEAHGIWPDAIAGTSTGAVFAGLYALGIHGLALEHLVRQQNNLEIWAQGIDFGLHRGALIHGRKLTNWLDRKFFFGARFEDTEIPLAVGCTDIETGGLFVISEGSIADAVRASCALPLFFSTVRWKRHFLIDGGFVEAVPYRTLKVLNPERMIGIHTGLNIELPRLVQATSRLSRSALGRAFNRVTNTIPISWPLGQVLRGVSIASKSFGNRVQAPHGTHLVRVYPPVTWLDFHQSPLAIAAGESAVLESLPRLFRAETLQQS